jgi:hypothetical protein
MPGGYAGDVDGVTWHEPLGREEVDTDRVGTAAIADQNKQRADQDEAEDGRGEHLEPPGSLDGICSRHNGISKSIWATGGMGLPEASLEGIDGLAGGGTVPPGWPLC